MEGLLSSIWVRKKGYDADAASTKMDAPFFLTFHTREKDKEENAG